MQSRVPANVPNHTLALLRTDKLIIELLEFVEVTTAGIAGRLQNSDAYGC
jgi:hypothetical protein